MTDLVSQIEALVQQRKTLASELASIDSQLERARLAIRDAASYRPLTPRTRPETREREHPQRRPDSASGQQLVRLLTESPTAMLGSALVSAMGLRSADQVAGALARQGAILRRRTTKAIDGYKGRAPYLYAIRVDQFPEALREQPDESESAGVTPEG